MSTIHPYRPDRKYWPYDIAIELGAIPLSSPPPPVPARIRYVNTASSAGGDGTTNATAGANRAYASLKTALTSEAADLVAADVYLLIYCEGSSADISSGGGPHFVISGYTTDASHYIHILVDQAQRHDGKWNTGKYRIQSGYDTLEIQNSHVVIEGLQIFGGYNLNDNGHKAVDIAGSVTNITLRECIIRFDAAAQTSFGGGCYGIFGGVDAAGTRFYINNLIYDFSDTTNVGIHTTNHTSGKTYVSHCTLHNCTTGILDGYSDTIVRNSVVSDCGTAFSGSFDANSDYNVTDAASAPGSNSKTSQTITFLDEANDDFHSSDTDLSIANNLYADGNTPVTIDIDGGARPSAGNVYAGFDEPAGDVTVNLSVLSILASIQSPAPNILSFPSALVAAAAVQAATPIVITFPAVLSPAAAAQAPAALADCLVSPAVLSILASAQAPTPAVLISPAVLSAAAAVQAPTVDTGSGNITASPAVLSIAASIQAPDKSVTTLPSALIAQASAPAPVVVLTLAPQALLAQASIQAPSPGIAATPAALSAQAATQAPGKEIRTLPGPAVAAASAIPAGASWAITAFPAVVSAYANLVAPTVTIGGPITDVSAIIVRARQRSFSAEARPRALSSGARRRGFGVDSQG